MRLIPIWDWRFLSTVAVRSSTLVNHEKCLAIWSGWAKNPLHTLLAHLVEFLENSCLFKETYKSVKKPDLVMQHFSISSIDLLSLLNRMLIIYFSNFIICIGIFFITVKFPIVNTFLISLFRLNFSIFLQTINFQLFDSLLRLSNSVHVIFISILWFFKLRFTGFELMIKVYWD